MAHLLARLAAAPLVRRYVCLRARFRAWLFGTPTSVLEWLNTAFLLAWAITLLDDALLQLPLYSAIGIARFAWANEALSAIFFASAVFATIGALRRDRRADKLSGYGLQLGAVLWSAVALNFVAAYPPLSTGVAVYAILAFFCWTAGGYLWERGCARCAR